MCLLGLHALREQQFDGCLRLETKTDAKITATLVLEARTSYYTAVHSFVSRVHDNKGILSIVVYNRIQ